MSAKAQGAGNANAEDFINDFAMAAAGTKARQLAVRPEFGDCDHEDIKQELLLYLLQRVDRYDASRSQRNTFINRMIESGAAEMVRSRTRQKRHPEGGNYMPSFQTPIDTCDGSSQTLGDEIEEADRRRRLCGEIDNEFEDVDRRLDFESAMEAMSPRMREVAEFLMSHNLTETQEHFSLSRRALTKLRDEIKQHLTRFDVL